MALKPPRTGLRTRCIHSGLASDPVTGSVAQPIYPSTIFQHPARDAAPRDIYTRQGNPNRDALETALADLEGGAAALAFASGSAAMTAVLSTLPHGSVTLFPDDYYNGTRLILQELFDRQLLWQEVDTTDLVAVKRRLTDVTQLVWIESPSNPLLKVTDIRAVAEAAHRAGAFVVVDSTLATPVLQRPLELGADIVVHSASKYMGGHSDVLMGALVFRERGELFEACAAQQYLGGGVPSPHDCWLVRRGLMTLP
ncbi:PLP-dependent transferase, partial [Candidatus Poribacteria bacterium]|nr:PLP-dependent transferase [Candidatus Poribacteria bacterium]